MGITTANIQDITSEEFEGAGVFDALMRSAKLHLEREYTENRIRGNDYATVYTGMVASVLQASIQYSLEKPLREERVQAEIDNMAKQRDLLNDQIQTEKAKLDETLGTLDSAVRVQARILEAQEDKAKAEAKTEEAKTDHLVGSTDSPAGLQRAILKEQLTVELAKNDPTLVVDNTVTFYQLEQAKQEALLATAKADTEKSQLSAYSDETDYPDYAGSTVQLQRAILSSQEALLAKKGTTEAAQTQTSTLAANSTTGVIGKQMDLYTAQISGYTTDQTVKAAKLFTDVLSVQLSTNPTNTDNANSMLNGQIDKVIDRVVETLPDLRSDYQPYPS